MWPKTDRNPQFSRLGTPLANCGFIDCMPPFLAQIAPRIRPRLWLSAQHPRTGRQAAFILHHQARKTAARNRQKKQRQWGQAPLIVLDRRTVNERRLLYERRGLSPLVPVMDESDQW
jgi:hypothetical protein